MKLRYSFKTHEYFEQHLHSLAKDVSKSASLYNGFIDQALTCNGKALLLLQNQVAQAMTSVEVVERMIREDEAEHHRLIALNDQEVRELEARLADKRALGERLRHNLLMSTGKTKAQAYVAKNALVNIQDALLSDDKGDLVVMKSKKEEWKAKVVEDQGRMMNGEANAIELILVNLQN